MTNRVLRGNKERERDQVSDSDVKIVSMEHGLLQWGYYPLGNGSKGFNLCPSYCLIHSRKVFTVTVSLLYKRIITVLLVWILPNKKLCCYLFITGDQLPCDTVSIHCPFYIKRSRVGGGVILVLQIVVGSKRFFKKAQSLVPFVINIDRKKSKNVASWLRGSHHQSEK